MARLLVVIVAVSAILATAGFAADPDCFQYSSCMTCTEAPSGKCGWDASSATCKPGTSTGPASGYEWSSTWWWTSTQCCEAKTDCTDCTSSGNGYCGYDVNRAQCMFGYSWGPLVGTSQSWVSSYSSCPSQCLTNYDCSSCLQQGGCGWMENAQQCVAGNSNGFFSGQDAVQGYALQFNYWYFSSCPSNWSLRWSANSYSLWCIVGGVGAVLLGASVAAGRRRRRIIQQQRRQMAAFAAQAQPTVGAPLLAQAADAQPAYAAQPVYGQPAPMPYYGALPEDGSCSGQAKTAY